jgi:ABC-2 type transport system permease protein
MPEILQAIMQFAPSTHFVTFAQAILYRGQALPWYGRIMPRSALSAQFSSWPHWRVYAKASP